MHTDPRSSIGAITHRAVPRIATILAVQLMLSGMALSAFASGPPPSPSGAVPLPRSGRIAFASDRDFATDPGGLYAEIYSADPDGSGVTRLTHDSTADWFPAWSPDGRTISFDSDHSGTQQIYTMNAVGSGVSQLTTDTAANHYGPSWSADGKSMVFGNFDTGEVWWMKADGSGQKWLTSGSRPAMSPDGQRVAFQSGDDQIYVMNVDGSHAVPLTSGLVAVGRPAWSPDGRSIVYPGKLAEGGSLDLFVVNADGSGTTSQRTDDTLDDSWPAWSPDGLSIAYTRGTVGGVANEIYVMNADGSDQVDITNDPANDWAPSWGIDAAEMPGPSPTP